MMQIKYRTTFQQLYARKSAVFLFEFMTLDKKSGSGMGYMLVILELCRCRQYYLDKCKAVLGYTARFCQKIFLQTNINDVGYNFD